jgi:hypothetical protein
VVNPLYLTILSRAALLLSGGLAALAALAASGPGLA